MRDDGERLTFPDLPGLTFRCTTEPDDTGETPWTREDGHGPVRSLHTTYGHPEKRPGEVVLYKNHWTYWLYDRQAALRTAVRDGWGPSEDWARHARHRYPGSRKARALMAVDEDMSRLTRFLEGDWYYVILGVALVDDDDNIVAGPEYLGGVESDCTAYLRETAHDIAWDLASSEGLLPEQRLQAWRGALREARERRYWASRDVVTVA